MSLARHDLEENKYQMNENQQELHNFEGKYTPRHTYLDARIKACLQNYT